VHPRRQAGVIARPINFTVRSTRNVRVTLSRNGALRVLAALLSTWVACAGANYYMDLGWFGHYARLVLSLSVLLVCFFLIIVERAWQREQ
jgi:hypothetical protein